MIRRQEESTGIRIKGVNRKAEESNEDHKAGGVNRDQKTGGNSIRRKEE